MPEGSFQAKIQEEKNTKSFILENTGRRKQLEFRESTQKGGSYRSYSKDSESTEGFLSP